MRLLSLSIIGLLAASATAASAATICVKPSGGGSCESTIQAAVNLAAAGDEIAVREGVYAEAVVIPAGKDGLTIRGSGRGTVIDAQFIGGPNFQIESANVTLRDLRVRNGDSNGVSSMAAGTHLLRLEITGSGSDCVSVSGDDATVENSRLFGCGSRGIDVVGNNATIVGNLQETGDSGGFFVNGSGALVESNRIYGAEDGDCIEVIGANAEVVGNRAAGCDGSIEVSGDNPIVERNRITAADTGFEIDCTVCADGEVRGNVVHDIGDDDGGFDISATGLLIEGNRSFNTADEAFYLNGSGNILRRNRGDLVGGDSYEPCVYVSGSNNTIERNRLARCTDAGIELSGSANVVSENRIVASREEGIYISGAGTQLSDNVVRSANGAAFVVGGGSTGTTFDDNHAGSDVRHDLCDMGTGTVVNANNGFTNTATSACEL